MGFGDGGSRKDSLHLELALAGCHRRGQTLQLKGKTGESSLSLGPITTNEKTIETPRPLNSSLTSSQQQ